MYIQKILVTALFISALVTHSSLIFAGALTPELEAALANNVNDDISVIIYFKGKLNKQIYRNQMVDKLAPGQKKPGSLTPEQLSARNESRRQHRMQFIQALKNNAASRQAAARSFLGQYLDASSSDLWLINGLAVTLPAKLLASVSRLPFVDRVGLDRKITLNELPTANGAVPTWNLDMVKATNLWNLGYTGAGVVIASMDTGVDGLHPDLAAQWRGGTNSWFNPYVPDSTIETPHDANGHGTQTMGVMVGGNASGTVVGVAPDAQWIAAKIFQDNDTATLSGIHAGFQWMLDPDGDPATDDAPDILNNSWGILTNVGVCDPEFDDDMDALNVAEVAIVFSAGNEGPGPGTGTSPATNAHSVSTGSLNEFYTLAFTSSRGPTSCSGDVFPVLTAPGVNIYTTDLSFGLGLLLNPYTGASGTSLAAPHISGVLALLKSAEGTSTVAELEAALKNSANDLDVLGPDDNFGYGLVDAQAALLKLRCPAGSVDSDDDGYYDACDNCSGISNSNQLDTDNDGYGNRCDVDLNNDGLVNILDIGLYRLAYISASPNADINGDGIVNVLDIGYVRSLLFKPPGPSGLVP